MPTDLQSSQTKLREAMLYIACRCEDDADFGLTKLYKMLFFAEASSYLARGVRLTDHAYLREQHGPMPRNGAGQIRVLEGEGLAKEVQVAHPIGGQLMRRLKVLKKFETSLLSPEDQAHLDQGIAEIKSLTATAASDLTHQMPIWRWAVPGQELDFSLLNHQVRIKSGPISPELRDEALASARAQGLL